MAAANPLAQESSVAQQLVEAGLTERQAEVLRLVARGLTYKEVGHALSISERTVRFHMTKIMDQLHLYNRAGVLAYARKLGIAPRG
jgi:two-component system NarL family response regulator